MVDGVAGVTHTRPFTVNPSAGSVETGKGTLIYPDGSKLVGEFRDDHANGEGVLHFKNGDVYEGGFKVRASGVYLGGRGGREPGSTRGVVV